MKMFEYEPELLTIKDCRRILHLGRNSMLNLIYEGQIKAFKLQGSWRVKKEDLIEFIRKIY